MLIATDLDGTLAPFGSLTVSPFTAKVLREVDAAGVPVVFVTARPLRWMEGFWPHVGSHGVGIVSNGALTYDAHAGTITAQHGIAPADGLGLVDTILDRFPGTRFAVECADGIRLDPHFIDEFPPPPDSPRGPLSDIWDVPAMKVLVRHPDIDITEHAEGIGLLIGDGGVVTFSGPGLVEISAPGISKASALIEVCATLGVDRSDVVAFGDAPNDVPMLEWAGLSYAMENGHESAKTAAHRIAPSVDEDGVAHVLLDLLAQL